MARPADPHARAALLKAALSEFSRHGIVKARIEDITHACGLSKGAFYLHFESKESLFGEVAGEVMARMAQLLQTRREAYAQLFEKAGPANRMTPAKRAALVQAFAEADARFDREQLEALWADRHVIDIFMRGTRGTDFELQFWDFVDAEVKRITAELEQTRAYGMCRPEVPTQVISSMVIGTWVMLMRFMVELKEKPDLDFWVRSIKELLNQGIAPQSLGPAPRRPAAKRNRKTPQSRRSARGA